MKAPEIPKMRLVTAQDRIKSPDEPPFKAGDIVELKSGGVPMTVEEPCGDAPGRVHVVWTAAGPLHQIMHDSVPASCLRQAELASDGRPVRKTQIADDRPF